MGEFFAGGRIVDMILALVAVEVLAIAVWRAKTQRGPALRDIAATLLAGCFLLLALRGALALADWRLIALCLLAAFAAHLIDLAQRWRR